MGKLIQEEIDYIEEKHCRDGIDEKKLQFIFINICINHIEKLNEYMIEK